MIEDGDPEQRSYDKARGMDVRLLLTREMPGGETGCPLAIGVFATGVGMLPRQWARPGLWGVDLEGNHHGALGVAPHVERAFRTEAAALAFARFLEWCVDGLTDEQLAECARVTDGRLL